MHNLEKLFAAAAAQDSRLKRMWINKLTEAFPGKNLTDVVVDRKLGPKHDLHTFNELKKTGKLRDSLPLAWEQSKNRADNNAEGVHTIGKKPEIKGNREM